MATKNTNPKTDKKPPVKAGPKKVFKDKTLISFMKAGSLSKVSIIITTKKGDITRIIERGPKAITALKEYVKSL